MVEILNCIDNFIFIISPNRKIKFVNQAVLNKTRLNLKQIIDTPVKNCLYTNGNSLDNLINSLEKYEKVNFDFYLDINEKRYYFNGDLLQSNFYGEENYFIVAKDIVEKYYKREDLEDLLDKINMGCFIKNKNGKYLYLNKKMCDDHNLTKDEIISSDLSELYTPEDEFYIESLRKEVAKRKETHCAEKQFTLEGESKWYEHTLDPILNEDGSIKSLVGSARNIDIRKYLNEILSFTFIELREINKFLDDDKYQENIMKLLDYISEKTMKYFKADGITVIFYDEAKTKFENLISKGITIGEFDDLDKKAIFNIIYNKYATGVRTEGIKYRDEIKDNPIVSKKLEEKNIYKVGIYNISLGDKLLGQMVITFLQDTKPIEHGFDYIKSICSHIAVTVSNINESRKIKDAIKEYRDKRDYLSKCIEISVDMIGKFDKNGKIIDVNCEQVKNILGWDYEDLKNNTTVFKSMQPRDVEFIKEKMENCSNLAIHRESKFLCKNGEYKWIEWNLKQYKDEDVFFFTARDINERKEFEKREKLLEQAVQMESLKNQFFNNISHEFRTPINIILGTVQLVERYRQNNIYKLEDIDYHMKYVKLNSYRLLRLVQNLIDLSQTENEYGQSYFKNYDIVSIVEDISMSVAQYLEAKDVNLIFDTNCEEQILSCDPEKIERIVLNLLSNAIKYNKDNNDIEVYMDIDEEFVRICVKDYGIGIENTDLSIIFEEFKKLNDGLTRPCEGSGIGLAIVNEFARLHNGSVSVTSELGVGSTFEVKIPIVIAEGQEFYISNRIAKKNIVEVCNIEFSDIYS